MRGPQLARLLGPWNAAGVVRRPDYAALAGAVRGLLHDGRLALGVRLPAERELAGALGISRTAVAAGVPTAADQVMITSGVQHALDLLLRLLVAPGQRIVVETPTYPNALTAFAAHRARVVSYALGGTGWDPDLLLATVRGAQAPVAYL